MQRWKRDRDKLTEQLFDDNDIPSYQQKMRNHMATRPFSTKEAFEGVPLTSRIDGLRPVQAPPPPMRVSVPNWWSAPNAKQDAAQRSPSVHK